MTRQDELRAMVAEATPGPWEACGEVWSRKVYADGENRVCFMAHSNGLNDDRDIATSELVAQAPTLAAELIAALDEVEMLQGLLDEIRQWASAYPVAVFPEPDFKRANELLQAGGMSIDAVSASNMRHVLNGLIRTTDYALTPITPETHDLDPRYDAAWPVEGKG